MSGIQLTKPVSGDTVAVMHTTLGDIKIKNRNSFGLKVPVFIIFRLCFSKKPTGLF